MNSIAAALLALAAGLAVSYLLGFVLIPWLHKLKFGQVILDIGPNWHKNKQGTPTMGGFMFAAGTVAAVAIVFSTDAIMGGHLISKGAGLPSDMKTKLFGGILMALCFCAVGFVDDYIKVVKKRNKGLSITQKTALQFFICAAYLTGIYLGMNGKPSMFIPFVGTVSGLYAYLFWPFGLIVIYATINAVNFTDGIDGLCSSVTTVAALALAVIAGVAGLYGATTVACALAGACAGFFLWNRHPAKVFMGDTGSMFLGGMVVAIAYAVNCPLILLPVGIIYFIEGLSDVIQIGYFKLTHGKRIFKMAPIHHHFEMSGWSENKIVLIFNLVGFAGCVAGAALMYYGRVS